jgi:membrane peptidoglycan carboxypeptidase
MQTRRGRPELGLILALALALSFALALGTFACGPSWSSAPLAPPAPAPIPPPPPPPLPSATVFRARELDPAAMNALLDTALADRAGPVAAVVLDAGDGRVLGLGRHRGADPATRAFRPGSSVKPIVAWIAADAGVLTPGDRVECRRAYAEKLSCFGEHGALGLADAIAVSCNVYFFELGRRLGGARLRGGLASFGFGKPTGLVAGEAAGVVGSDGSAEVMATGHGAFEATPLQLAAAYAKLARRFERGSEIADGLRRAIDGEQGTGRLAAVDGIRIAGKTGTAEAARAGASNGWFVGYAPANDPEIVVAVLAEESEPGGTSAAPIAARIFRALASCVQAPCGESGSGGSSGRAQRRPRRESCSAAAAWACSSARWDAPQTQDQKSSR